MWIEEPLFREDMERIANAEYIPWEKLKNSTIFITGATGLIGFNIISALSYVAIYKKISLNIIALVRDVTKAKYRFKDILAVNAPIKFVLGDLNKIPIMKEEIDYIIHGGSPTSSRFFVEHPVETVEMNISAACQLLKIAKTKKVKGFLFLSSMEIYGDNHRQDKVSEAHESFVNPMKPRNSYPEVKRMVESLCTCYASEYDVPANVIRLTQTFGAGVRAGDRRIFAQFLDAIKENEDIILCTEGRTKRSYLYTRDAVTAVFAVLLNGKAGEAYNAANEGTYCSIREMADIAKDVGNKIRGNSINVNIKLSEKKQKLYPPELYMNLATDKIRSLGWKPTISLEDMFARMISICD